MDDLADRTRGTPHGDSLFLEYSNAANLSGRLSDLVDQLAALVSSYNAAVKSQKRCVVKENLRRKLEEIGWIGVDQGVRDARPTGKLRHRDINRWLIQHGEPPLPRRGCDSYFLKKETAVFRMGGCQRNAPKPRPATVSVELCLFLVLLCMRYVLQRDRDARLSAAATRERMAADDRVTAARRALVAFDVAHPRSVWVKLRADIDAAEKNLRRTLDACRTLSRSPTALAAARADLQVRRRDVFAQIFNEALRLNKRVGIMVDVFGVPGSTKMLGLSQEASDALTNISNVIHNVERKLLLAGLDSPLADAIAAEAQRLLMADVARVADAESAAERLLTGKLKKERAAVTAAKSYVRLQLNLLSAIAERSECLLQENARLASAVAANNPAEIFAAKAAIAASVDAIANYQAQIPADLIKPQGDDEFGAASRVRREELRTRDELTATVARLAADVAAAELASSAASAAAAAARSCSHDAVLSDDRAREVAIAQRLHLRLVGFLREADVALAAAEVASQDAEDAAAQADLAASRASADFILGRNAAVRHPADRVWRAYFGGPPGQHLIAISEACAAEVRYAEREYAQAPGRYTIRGVRWLIHLRDLRELARVSAIDAKVHVERVALQAQAAALSAAAKVARGARQAAAESAASASAVRAQAEAACESAAQALASLGSPCRAAISLWPRNAQLTSRVITRSSRSRLSHASRNC